MNVLGTELELDFFDADQLEIYERENLKVKEDIKEPTQYEGKSAADSIRIQCHIVDKFFDAVFGDGTAKRLFKGKCNLRDHMEAFGIVSQGAMESRKEIDALNDKYSPNRADRRLIEKNNRKTQKQNSKNYNYHAAGKGKNRNH